LREGANAGQHTPTLSLPPSHHCLDGEVYRGNRRTHVRTRVVPLYQSGTMVPWYVQVYVSMDDCMVIVGDDNCYGPCQSLASTMVYHWYVLRTMVRRSWYTVPLAGMILPIPRVRPRKHYLKNDLKYKRTKWYHGTYSRTHNTMVPPVVHVYYVRVRTNGTMVHVYKWYTFTMVAPVCLYSKSFLR
jgi:hypothetical protein